MKLDKATRTSVTKIYQSRHTAGRRRFRLEPEDPGKGEEAAGSSAHAAGARGHDEAVPQVRREKKVKLERLKSHVAHGVRKLPQPQIPLLVRRRVDLCEHWIASYVHLGKVETMMRVQTSSMIEPMKAIQDIAALGRELPSNGQPRARSLVADEPGKHAGVVIDHEVHRPPGANLPEQPQDLRSRLSSRARGKVTNSAAS